MGIDSFMHYVASTRQDIYSNILTSKLTIFGLDSLIYSRDIREKLGTLPLHNLATHICAIVPNMSTRAIMTTEFHVRAGNGKVIL